MKVTGLAIYEEDVDLFNMLQLDSVIIENLDELEKDVILIVYDQNRALKDKHINEIFNSGRQLIYFFKSTKKDNIVIESLIKTGFYDIHEVENLTLDIIIDSIENRMTKGEAEKYLDKVLEVKDFEQLVGLMDKLVCAINEEDEEVLENICENNINDLLGFKDSMREIIVKDNDLGKEIEEVRRDLDTEKEHTEDLRNRLNRLVIAGRETESKNVELTTMLERMRVELENKQRELNASNDTIRDLTGKVTTLENDKFTLNNNISSLKNEIAIVKSENSKNLRELDLISSKLNMSKMNLEDIFIKVINVGKVEKYLYIKMLDMIPNLENYILKYPRHAKARLGVRDCSLFIIAPKSSSIYKVLSAEFKDLTELEESTIPAGVYLLNGFSEKIEDFISRLDSQLLVILDMTLRSSTLCSSIRQKNIYLVNSKETIVENRLNPSDCISYEDLTSEGVQCRIPVVPDGTGRAATLKLISDTFYNVLDTYWR